MYDNKRVDYYAKHPEELRISIPWLSKCFDCTPEGRKICQGRCCYGHVNELSNNKIFVKYYDDEWELIPSDIKKELKPFLTDERIVKVNNNRCSLTNFCLENPQYKPRECKLYPLTITKNGLLVLDRNVFFICPNYKKGLPLWITLKNNLIDLFGQEFYDRLQKEMEV